MVSSILIGTPIAVLLLSKFSSSISDFGKQTLRGVVV